MKTMKFKVIGNYRSGGFSFVILQSEDGQLMTAGGDWTRARSYQIWEMLPHPLRYGMIVELPLTRDVIERLEHCKKRHRDVLFRLKEFHAKRAI